MTVHIDRVESEVEVVGANAGAAQQSHALAPPQHAMLERAREAGDLLERDRARLCSRGYSD
jgi:hypothetical protein